MKIESINFIHCHKLNINKRLLRNQLTRPSPQCQRFVSVCHDIKLLLYLTRLNQLIYCNFCRRSKLENFHKRTNEGSIKKLFKLKFTLVIKQVNDFFMWAKLLLFFFFPRRGIIYGLSENNNSKAAQKSNMCNEVYILCVLLVENCTSAIAANTFARNPLWRFTTRNGSRARLRLASLNRENVNGIAVTFSRKRKMTFY